MSRLVNRPVEVKLKDSKPYAFVDRDYTHAIVRIVDSWIEAGEWWNDEPSHYIYTVLTADYFLYDIERVGDEWFIYRVWD